MKTAVVILNWNGKEFLKQFLPSVTKFSDYPDCKIIVADNNSSDDSIDFITKNYPQIKTIILDKNYGFAGGYNIALRDVEAEYFILLNSDVELTQGWLDPLINLMDSNMSIAAVAPKILAYNDKTRFEYAGAAGGFIDMLGYPFCRGRILARVENDNGQYDDKQEIFWASGACMVIRSSVFRLFGGFDADFFAHQEEIDLCWRIKQAGYKIYIEPNSIVYHIGGGTLSSENPRKTYLNFRNNLYMLYKNLSTRSLFPVITLRLCLDGLSALVFLLQRKTDMAKAVFSAHMDFYKSIPSLRKKRAEVLSHRLCNPSQIYRGSIVFNYFCGKDKYSDICHCQK